MAQTVNEKLLHKAVDHAIDLQRYSNSEVQKMLSLLNRVDVQIAVQLTAALERMPANSFTVQRLNSMLKDVYNLIGSPFKDIKTGIESNLLDLVKEESEYQYDLFKTVIPIDLYIARISPELVHAAAMARPFQISKDKAVNLSDYVDGLSDNRKAGVRDAIRLGFVTGESTDQIVRRIMGTKTQNYADGLMQASRHHVEGMVRTAVNHTASFARQRFYGENSEIIKGVMWVSTLDARTSPICQSRDGKVYPVDSGPRPPAHISCRSSTVPVLKSWRDLGINMDEFKSERASMDGQVPRDLTYQEWLEKQPTKRQDDILGPTKGKLFRAGEKLDRFIDNKGRTLTIEQLRSKNKQVFDELGI